MVGAFMAKVRHDILTDRAFEHVISEEAEPDIRERVSAAHLFEGNKKDDDLDDKSDRERKG